MTASQKIRVPQYTKTPDDRAHRSIGARSTKGTRERLQTVDRIALGAMFAVAILILVMSALTYKSALQPVPPAASSAMSFHVGRQVSVSEHRVPKIQRKEY